MPYAVVMPVTAQPQHNKWRKLTYYPQPLTTIQAREQLMAYVPDSELPSASTDWLTKPTTRGTPTTTPVSRWLNSSQATDVSGTIRFTPRSWRKARRLGCSESLDGRIWTGLTVFAALPASPARA
jgi:hypothetical protein